MHIYFLVVVMAEDDGDCTAFIGQLEHAILRFIEASHAHVHAQRQKEEYEHKVFDSREDTIMCWLVDLLAAFKTRSFAP